MGGERFCPHTHTHTRDTIRIWRKVRRIISVDTTISQKKSVVGCGQQADTPRIHRHTCPSVVPWLCRSLAETITFCVAVLFLCASFDINNLSFTFVYIVAHHCVVRSRLLLPPRHFCPQSFLLNSATTVWVNSLSDSSAVCPTSGQYVCP